MKRMYLILSILLLISWLVGYFILQASTPVHIFIPLSLLLLLQSVISAGVPKTNTLAAFNEDAG